MSNAICPNCGSHGATSRAAAQGGLLIDCPSCHHPSYVRMGNAPSPADRAAALEAEARGLKDELIQLHNERRAKERLEAECDRLDLLVRDWQARAQQATNRRVIAEERQLALEAEVDRLTKALAAIRAKLGEGEGTIKAAQDLPVPEAMDARWNEGYNQNDWISCADEWSRQGFALLALIGEIQALAGVEHG